MFVKIRVKSLKSGKMFKAIKAGKMFVENVKRLLKT